MHAASGPIAVGMIGRHHDIVDLDDAYSALLGVDRAAVVGRPAVDFAHPDDRAAVAAFLQRAWDGSGAARATLRHLDGHGDWLWVNVHISRLGRGDHACLVVTCRPLPRGDKPSTVETHWQMARLLIQALEGGKRAFGDSLIGNPAAEILLLSYVAEAEARTIPADEVAARINVSWPLTRRWLVALSDIGFIESETPGPIVPSSPIRLSPRALAMIEAIFGALVAVVQDALVPA